MPLKANAFREGGSAKRSKSEDLPPVDETMLSGQEQAFLINIRCTHQIPDAFNVMD
jgi:hypothetical protein